MLTYNAQKKRHFFWDVFLNASRALSGLSVSVGGWCCTVLSCSVYTPLDSLTASLVKTFSFYFHFRLRPNFTDWNYTQMALTTIAHGKIFASSA